jgi:hypothetical protein
MAELGFLLISGKNKNTTSHPVQWMAGAVFLRKN